MGNTAIEKSDNVRNPLGRKLAVIEALVFLIPGLTIVYIFYQKQISFDKTQMFLFLAVLMLILSGIMMLRQFFDRILMVQSLIKKTEAGDQYFLDVKKGTGELHEITMSFNNLMKNFQE